VEYAITKRENYNASSEMGYILVNRGAEGDRKNGKDSSRFLKFVCTSCRSSIYISLYDINIKIANWERKGPFVHVVV
jgi:hypothetical protein